MKRLKNKWLWLITGAIIIIAVTVINGNQAAQTVQGYRVDQGVVAAFIEDDAIARSHETKVYYAELSGVIEDVKVAVGDEIAKATVLAVYNSEELRYQLDELSAVKQGLIAGSAEISQPDNALLIQQMKSLQTKARLNVEDLTRQLNSQRKLYQSGAVSLESVRQLEAMLSVAVSDLTAANAQLKQVQKGGSSHLIDQANSQVAALDVQIERLNNQLEKSQIVAETNGTVVSKTVEEGQFATIGTALFTVENPQKVQLEALLLAEDIVDLQVGSAVEVISENQVIVKGEVKQIYPKALSTISDLGVEQKRVKVIIDSADAPLKLGYQYDIKVYLKQLEALRIPDSAYFTLDQQGKVFVVENDTLSLKDVEVVFKGNDYYAVEGLREGEIIVQSPSSTLEEGIKVVVQ